MPFIASCPQGMNSWSSAFPGEIFENVTISWQVFAESNRKVYQYSELAAVSRFLPEQLVFNNIDSAVWILCSNRFGCARTGWCCAPCHRSAGCPGQAEQKVAGIGNRKAAAAVAGRSRVHARHDHASCASRGDDGANFFAYSKQGSAITGGAHQQFTVQ